MDSLTIGLKITNYAAANGLIICFHACLLLSFLNLIVIIICYNISSFVYFLKKKGKSGIFLMFHLIWMISSILIGLQMTAESLPSFFNMEKKVSSVVIFLKTAKKIPDTFRKIYNSKKTISIVFELYECLHFLMGRDGCLVYYSVLHCMLDKLEVHQFLMTNLKTLRVCHQDFVIVEFLYIYALLYGSRCKVKSLPVILFFTDCYIL